MTTTSDRPDHDSQPETPPRRFTRREILKVAGSAALMSLAAACGAQTTAPPAAPATAPAAKAPVAAPTTAPAVAKATEAPKAAAVKRGGIFNWGEPADPISFDPHNRNNASGTVLKRMIYQSLTRHNARTMTVDLFNKGVGHYTQMVWKGSTQIGAGISQYQHGGFTMTVLPSSTRRRNTPP